MEQFMRDFFPEYMDPVHEVLPWLWQGSMRALSWETVKWEGKFDVIYDFTFDQLDAPKGTTVKKMSFDDSSSGIEFFIFEELIDSITDVLQNPKVIICMCCQMGENRSGLGSVIALCVRGYKVQDAIDLIRKKLPTRGGKEYVLWNETFEQQLRDRFA